MIRKHEIKTILVIEDEADVLNFASRVLELEGYRILRARDAEEGMKLMRDGHIRLVLLDLRLPGRDGWMVLEQIKSEPRLSAIPVIVFTASAGVSARKRALSMGAAGYLVKPVSAARLKNSVIRVLCRQG